MSRPSLLKRLTTWLHVTVLRRRFEADVDEEIRFHLDEHARTLMAQGMPEVDARRRARIDFGGAESSRDGVRSVLGLRPMDELLADIQYGFRVLRKTPGFTAIAAGSLALAIGANTTVFSVANFMLLQRLAVPHAEQLRMLYREDGRHSVFHMSWGDSLPGANGVVRSDSFSYPVYQQMQRDARKTGLEIAAFKNISTANASFDGSAQAVQPELVSGNFYSVMQVAPEIGRVLQPADDGAPGAGTVAVLSYGFWQRAFGGSPNVLGKVIRVDTTPVTIVGVNAKGFTGADGAQQSPDVFLPMSMIATLRGSLGREHVLTSTQLCWIQMLLRKPADMTEQRLQTQLGQYFHTAVLATVTPAKDETVPGLLVEDGSRGLAQSDFFYRKPIYVLLTLVGCVLLLACANVANLMLARASNRRREIGVRLALGAGRARVFRQLLVESLLLAAIGGAGGAILGYLGRTAAPALLQTEWETATVLSIPFSGPVFAFTFGITLLTGILFGVAPAWQSTRDDVNTALKQNAHSATRQRKAWTSKGLVAFQVAMATLLVAGSALFLRTMLNLTSINPGFQPEGLLLFHVEPPDKQYAGQKSVALHRTLVERFAAVPGVEGVSTAAVPLVASSSWNNIVRLEGEPEAKGAGEIDAAKLSNVEVVTPDFFSVMKIPLIAGRGFTTVDTATSPQVAVVNQAFVRKFFPGKSPIGARIAGDDDGDEGKGKKTPAWVTIVGVCADTQYNDLRTKPAPLYLTNALQSHNHSESAQGFSYIVRSQFSPAALIPSLKRAAAQVDPDLPLVGFRTQVQQIREATRQERTFASLTSGFGLLALALACVGIYGLMAYTVSQRTHEIGIRLALGAERARVRGMILREATWLAVIGVVVGSTVAFALARFVEGMLYQLHAHDPLSLLVSGALLLAVALLSSYLPAVRASRLEPVIALRQD